MTADDPTCSAPARALRRDAQRNRDGLVAAARECFAEHGLDAPLEQVAKRAGVAIGTLYRHFPTRIDLVQAIFADKLQDWLDAAEQALGVDDAWQGFCHFLQTMCELQADDLGFSDLVCRRLPQSEGIERAQSRIYELGVEIVHRAQRQGVLRPDVTPEDLAFVVWSHSQITAATQGIAPNAWRRYLHLMLDAFRVDRAHPLPYPPLSPGQVYRAMVRLGEPA
jgi:AcrR family transcriptional regulator